MFPEEWQYHVAPYIAKFIKWLTVEWEPFFDGLTNLVLGMLLHIEAFLKWVPWWAWIIIVVLICTTGTPNCSIRRASLSVKRSPSIIPIFSRSFNWVMVCSKIVVLPAPGEPMKLQASIPSSLNIVRLRRANRSLASSTLCPRSTLVI
jgi:hypothetical protein